MVVVGALTVCSRESSSNPAPSAPGAARSTSPAVAHKARRPGPADIHSQPRQVPAALTTATGTTQVVKPRG